jgi:hypothetical protein
LVTITTQSEKNFSKGMSPLLFTERRTLTVF